jgi:hypothetical protein
MSNVNQVKMGNIKAIIVLILMFIALIGVTRFGEKTEDIIEDIEPLHYEYVDYNMEVEE